MIDTHTHLYSSSYGEDYADAIKRSVDAGVSHMILPGVDRDSIESIRECHRKFPDNTFMTMGLHPTEVGDDWEDVVMLMEKELATGDYVAVGEIGMDLYWDKSNIERQRMAFRRQLQIADRLQLPVVLHCREAFEETLEVINEVKPRVPIAFHSYTSDKETVKKIREVCDPYFGINGVVTYKNAPLLRESLDEIGIDRIILETDAPYLTPVPHRGKRNESSYLPFIRDKIAETLNISAEEVEKATDNNTRKFFRL